MFEPKRRTQLSTIADEVAAKAKRVFELMDSQKNATENFGSSRCSSASKFPQFTCNPVFRSMFELGDPKNTKVEFSGAGEVVHIIQGDQLIEVSIGFFRDVCIVFDRSMEQCENDAQASEMLFHGLGSSRSYPTADWD